MVEYLLIAVAFATMMHFRYIMEVFKIVEDLRVHLDIEHEKNPFTPKLFAFVFFIVSAIFMPIVALYTVIVEREEVLKDISGAILKSYFRLEEK